MKSPYKIAIGLFLGATAVGGIALATAPPIETVAGNLLNFSQGDGLPATDPGVGVAFPPDLAVDGDGNIFIVDKGHKIRFVRTDGTIWTVVGDGVAGTTTYRLWDPTGIAIQGNQLYIVESAPSRVRRATLPSSWPAAPLQPQVLPLTVFAGGPLQGYSGDNGPAATARFRRPKGIAVTASGIVYVADTGNHVIRKIARNEFDVEVVTTFAGTGIPGYNGEGTAVEKQLDAPERVAVDAAGNVFIADTGNNRIRKVTPTGEISTVAGTGALSFFAGESLATATPICAPAGVTVDAFGNIYFSEGCGHSIRRVDAGTGLLSRIVGQINVFGDPLQGNGPHGTTATEAALNLPNNVRLDNTGRLVFVDTNNHLVRRVQVSDTPPPPADSDFDGVLDLADNCVITPNANQANLDGDAFGDVCDPDVDNDTIQEPPDNCGTVPNTDQNNLDGDAEGDACDADRDGDGVPNANDNCPDHVNTNQLDQDSDQLGDVCDGNGLVKKLSPVLECVVHHPEGFFTARFGYLNGNPQPIELPVGTKNRFTPAPTDRDQPTTFLPGRRRYVFEVPFTSGNLVWTLDGKTSTASNNPVQKCACLPTTGQVCGCLNDGVVRCDGTCTGTLPPANTPNCEACGGQMGCSGQCSIPLPPDLGELCCSGQGRILCGGGCSVACTQ